MYFDLKMQYACMYMNSFGQVTYTSLKNYLYIGIPPEKVVYYVIIFLLAASLANAISSMQLYVLPCAVICYAYAALISEKFGISGLTYVTPDIQLPCSAIFIILACFVLFPSSFCSSKPRLFHPDLLSLRLSAYVQKDQ